MKKKFSYIKEKHGSKNEMKNKLYITKLKQQRTILSKLVKLRIDENNGENNSNSGNSNLKNCKSTNN
jgi:hypothetical protein